MTNEELYYRIHKSMNKEGAPPISFRADGVPLMNWIIYGYTSPNLFDESAITVGKKIDSTGEIVDDENYFVSDYIFVNGSRPRCRAFVTSGGNYSGGYTNFYDAEKTLIKTTRTALGVSATMIATPTGAAYLRFSGELIFSKIEVAFISRLSKYEPFGSVGIKTSNLLDIAITQGGWTGSNGNAVRRYGAENPSFYNIRLATAEMLPVDPTKTYTVRAFPTSLKVALKRCDANGVQLSDTGWQSSATVTGTSLLAITVANNNTSARISLSDLTGLMVVEGSIAPTDYEPYGYKIPVICGGGTTDIYIGDSQLGDGQSVSYSDIGTPIPTIDGENTLTIDTPVQPSSVRIGGFTDLTEAQLAYLRYKYDVKK